MAESETESRRRSKAAEESLEAQVAQLQADIRSIADTLAKLGESKADGLRAAARSRAEDIAGKGQAALDNAQDEFHAIEKQLSKSIRDRPIAAVAGALAVGYVIALLSR